MATATRERQQTRHPLPATFVPPPPLPPRRHLPGSAGDDDPQERAVWEERERWLEEEANGETSFGCDYPDGALSQTGCHW